MSADGKRLLCVAGGGADALIRAWDLPDKERYVRRLPNANRSLVAFSADCRIAAWPSGKKVTVWDLENDHEVTVLTGFPDSVIRLALSPDGGQVACGMRGYAEGGVNLRVYDLRATGKVLFEFKGHGMSVWGLAFSRDGAAACQFVTRDGTGASLGDDSGSGHARYAWPDRDVRCCAQSRQPLPRVYHRQLAHRRDRHDIRRLSLPVSSHRSEMTGLSSK